MDFKELAKSRRSIRTFTDEAITPEDIKAILRAALMAPTGKNTRSWQFIVVEKEETLQKLSLCRPMGSQFLEGAKAAIVVLGNPDITDTWVEDCSIAAATIQYQAAELGLGSCWCQIRNRSTEHGESSNLYLREILRFPEDLIAECIIGLGHPAQQRNPQNEAALKWDSVTWNR